MCTQRTAYSGASLHSDKGKIIVVNLDQLRFFGWVGTHISANVRPIGFIFDGETPCMCAQLGIDRGKSLRNDQGKVIPTNLDDPLDACMVREP